MTDDYMLNVLSAPGVLIAPLEDAPLLTNLGFIPGKRSSASPGFLVDQVKFGGFTLAWDKFDFILFIVTWPIAYGYQSQHYILHAGSSEEPARQLLVTAGQSMIALSGSLCSLSSGAWKNALHEEVWVFDSGNWQKDHSLWVRPGSDSTLPKLRGSSQSLTYRKGIGMMLS